MADSSSPKIAKRLGSVIKLKPELYEKYKELHAAVWPEVKIRPLAICNCKFTKISCLNN